MAVSILTALALPSYGGNTFLALVEGNEALLEMVSDTSARIVESRRVLSIDPEVTVPASAASAVPALVAKYAAISSTPSGVGGFYTFRYASARKTLVAASRMWQDGLEASPVVRREQKARFVPADPLYPQQWHLRNRGQRGGRRKVDINVAGAWMSSLGQGVAIAVVDDGLQLSHPDLKQNVFPLTEAEGKSMHFDFVRGATNPRPGRKDDHGTAVAGLIAAASNSAGGVGVAPRARLAGLRVLGAAITDRTEARALGHRRGRIHIYNNSWGPPDDGDLVSGPGPLAAAALRHGTRFGRGGRGNIFIWSAGNGRRERDDSNYDGYANAIETIAVAAVSDRGKRSGDSEAGANIVVSAPSSSSGRQGLITCDLQGQRGYNADGSNDGSVLPRRNLPDRNYTNDFGGTSGAAPIVAGVVGLMLEANPRLGWREVQDVLIRTARRIDMADSGWAKNGAGIWFHHAYGAGLVDATAAVRRAKAMRRLGAQLVERKASGAVDLPIADNNSSGVEINFDLSAGKDLRVEHVQFLVTLAHGYRGDLRYELISPSGTKSCVQARPLDNGRRLAAWPFTTVQHWGESSRGIWRLRVIDTNPSDAGTLRSAEIVVLGASAAG